MLITFADVPERSNGTVLTDRNGGQGPSLGPVSLALTQVRILASALLLRNNLEARIAVAILCIRIFFKTA